VHDGVLSAKVVHLKGGARYKTGSLDWQPLKVGAIVKPGTYILTAAESQIDLVLGAEMASYQHGAEQNTVRIWDNSLLAIDKLTIKETSAGDVTETQLNLKAGHIYGVVKKMSAASQYEVKIPNGVAGMRGTVFDISAEGDVKVFSGAVVLAYVGSDGKVMTQVITGSQEFDARTGALRSTGSP
jgi:hypothetical protein